MRLLVVVQRYGPDVAGGAELAARLFATRLAGRGHDVAVLTTCARSYVDWANQLPPGTSELEGVVVHRLPVAHRRVAVTFGALNSRVLLGSPPRPASLEREWMRQQGPVVPELEPWLAAHGPAHDAVAFFTYLYYPSFVGLPAAWRAGVPTVFHPTAHDEPALALPLYDRSFQLADAFGFFTPEEGELVRRRFRAGAPSAVVGIGQDLDRPPGDVDAFRRGAGVGDAPYLLFVGRVDRGKGAPELFDFFTVYKARRPGPLRLVVVGDPVLALPPHPEVAVVGMVDEATKGAALAGATALVLPSYFESFSMVLTEAWAHRRPALVQGRCAVLAGQARRSGGALPYRGYAEFEAAVDLLTAREGLRRRLGAAGRRYVERTYAWDAVLDRYEALVEAARWWSAGRRPAPRP